MEPGGKTDCVLDDLYKAVLKRVHEETGLEANELKPLLSSPISSAGRRSTNFFAFEVAIDVATAAQARLRSRGGYVALDPLKWFDFRQTAVGDRELLAARPSGVLHESTRKTKVLWILYQRLFGNAPGRASGGGGGGIDGGDEPPHAGEQVRSAVRVRPAEEPGTRF